MAWWEKEDVQNILGSISRVYLVLTSCYFTTLTPDIFILSTADRRSIMEKLCKNINISHTETDLCCKRGLPTTNDAIRFDDIIKSQNDERLYRGLILPNKMKVLLISDSTTDKSAASLDVNVGTMSDPAELPGLAHFCEHMLFLGTEKYPGENDYTKYISEHGGASDASTGEDYTNYYFDVDPENLSGALDRFSQFFLTPLFTESATERELNAVDLEHESNVKNDAWRISQLHKSLANPKHPYSKFGTGSKETLDVIPRKAGINVRDELLKFHEKWYSANIMSLSVLGKESLEELETLVTTFFSNVKNANVDLPNWVEHPFSEEHFQTKLYIVPIKDTRDLSIMFPLPDLREYFRSAPSSYVSHLLGHEGEGSLLSTLKTRGWSSSLLAVSEEGSRGFNFFGIYVDLTEKGMEHIDDIVLLTFQYINLVKTQGPISWIFEEYKAMGTINFGYQEKSSPCGLVNSTVGCLRHYPMQEVLTGPRLFKEWRPDLIEKVLSYLTPENVRISVVAQQYEDIASEKETWYGTRYMKEKIPNDIIEKWRNAGLNPDLRLPAKNEFIPTNFELKPQEPDANKFPVIIEDTALMRVWFKQDDEFLLPKANLSFDFISPLAYMDPVSRNLAHMFVELFRDSLNEYTYAAELAGVWWSLSHSNYGMTLVIGGYSDKQRIFLEKIIDQMASFKVDPQRFEIIKENYIRSLKNMDADQPHDHADYHLRVLLAETKWTTDELLDSTPLLTEERVQQFILQMLGKVHIECLLHGNVTKSEALDMAKLFEFKLINTLPQVTPLLPRQLLLCRDVKLEEGCNFLYEVDNNLHKSSCVQVYYQCDHQALESNMLLELLDEIIFEPYFDNLRTKEQLGYIISSGIRRTNSAQGLIFTVQSDKHPRYVEQRIEAFLEAMLGQLVDIPEEEFSRHKDALATRKLEKPKMLDDLSSLFWSEILGQRYNFDRANIEVSYMRTITKEMVVKFYKDVLLYSAPTRCKLSVHVVSMAEGGAGRTEVNVTENGSSPSSESHLNTACRINDAMAFSSTQALYPLVKPFIDIPKKNMSRCKL
ncbi:LOW QUALITY PROTEIN: insulin-degrading enzyme-like [Diprion similis]|uniref:LOW QUALITY PROTEIN: insulin-degrading enzyme-like n=1 Tax=Diprion similis TaxID=362088 RepID=UPI001EF938BD|nr:LOW QUALITY PROTEIN: insulin-degrading enzyme-like [Diprion similis]